IADRSELLDLFGYDVTGIAPATVEVDCLELGRERFRTGTPVRFAGDLAPISASILAWGSLTACERGTMSVPLLTVKRYPSGGKAVVWNIGTFGHDDFNVAEKLNVPVKTGLFGLPKAVLDALRATATEPLGFTVEALPRVACFLFAEHLVLVNYASGSREVRVEGLSIDTESLLTDSANTSCQGGEFLLAQRSFAAVKIRR
ncbi:MAG: hypothetical protein QG656_935, partial [Candidatus Hydrogenedentes bacterium]|nr:hypothetical protein [Candidatus Hydrogenedentota bacterium]